MQPFYILLNLGFGIDPPAVMSATPNGTSMPENLWPPRCNAEQYAAIREQYAPANVISFVDDCGVYATRAAARTALNSLSASDKDEYKPRVVRIGDKTKRTLRKVKDYDVHYTSPNRLSGLWESGFKTRSAARAAKAAMDEYEKKHPLPSGAWTYRVVTNYVA